MIAAGQSAFKSKIHLLSDFKNLFEIRIIAKKQAFCISTVKTLAI